MKKSRLNTLNYTNDRRKKGLVYISPTKEVKHIRTNECNEDVLVPEIKIISETLSKMECAIIPETCLTKISKAINSRRLSIRETVFCGIIE